MAASVLAAGYLCAALALPVLLPVVAASAAVAACALVLTRRAQPRLARAMVAIAVWLGFGFTGAWLLRDSGVAGLAWVLVALFLLPLPIIPWLYARTFSGVEPNPPDGAS